MNPTTNCLRLTLLALALGCAAGAPSNDVGDDVEVEHSTRCVPDDFLGVHVGARRPAEVAMLGAGGMLDRANATWVRVLHQTLPCRQNTASGCGDFDCDGGELERWSDDVAAFHADGRKVLLIFNAWVVPACPGSGNWHAPTPKQTHAVTDAWLGQWERHFRRVIAHLRDRDALPDAVQIGNEPNSIEDMDCGAFGRLLERAEDVMVEQGVDVPRVTGGVVNHPGGWTAGPDCLELAAAATTRTLDYDGIGVHFYGALRADDDCLRTPSRCDATDALPQPAYEIESLASHWPANLAGYREVRTRFGADPRFWVTETGGPLYAAASHHTIARGYLERVGEWTETMRTAHEDYKAAWHAESLRVLGPRADVARYFAYRMQSNVEQLGVYASGGGPTTTSALFGSLAICDDGGDGACGTVPANGSDGARCVTRADGNGPWLPCCGDGGGGEDPSCGTVPANGSDGARCVTRADGNGPWLPCCGDGGGDPSCGTVPANGSDGTRCVTRADGNGPWLPCCGDGGGDPSCGTVPANHSGGSACVVRADGEGPWLPCCM